MITPEDAGLEPWVVAMSVVDTKRKKKGARCYRR